MDNQYAYLMGQGAHEYAPQGKAAEEMADLWAWCRKRLTKQGEGSHEQKKQRA